MRLPTAERSGLQREHIEYGKGDLPDPTKKNSEVAFYKFSRKRVGLSSTKPESALFGTEGERTMSARIKNSKPKTAIKNLLRLPNWIKGRGSPLKRTDPSGGSLRLGGGGATSIDTAG